MNAADEYILENEGVEEDMTFISGDCALEHEWDTDMEFALDLWWRQMRDKDVTTPDHIGRYLHAASMLCGLNADAKDELNFLKDMVTWHGDVYK